MSACFLKSLTFHSVDWWCAQDIVQSRAHLETGCQEHPRVWMTQLPAAPQSGGALASSWPTPQWFESPGHLLHLGGTTGKLNCQSSKRKDGSWSATLLIHVGHHHQMIVLLCAAWGQDGTSALTIESMWQRFRVWNLWKCEFMWLKEVMLKKHYTIGAMFKCASIYFLFFAFQLQIHDLCHACAKNQNLFTFAIAENVDLEDDTFCVQHFSKNWICVKYRYTVVGIWAKQFRGLHDFPFSQRKVGKIWNLSISLHCCRRYSLWGTNCFLRFLRF